MRIIQASAEIESFTENLLGVIERAGRTCYKSEDKCDSGSSTAFIKRMIDSHHESVLEHGAITVRFVVDRGVSHELVRHRLASFSQESSRYCNYSKEKFGNEITVIDPRPAFPEMAAEARFPLWKNMMAHAEVYYLALLQDGATAQEARSVLPNSLKTEVVLTANPREWRHIFKMRCAKAAHPQMREVMVPLLKQFKEKWEPLFFDIEAGE